MMGLVQFFPVAVHGFSGEYFPVFRQIQRRFFELNLLHHSHGPGGDATKNFGFLQRRDKEENGLPRKFSQT
jgi:hypothetical protein